MPTWTPDQLAAFKILSTQRGHREPNHFAGVGKMVPSAGGEIVGVKESKTSKLEVKFATWWKTCGGMPLATQHKFHTARRWKFDFAHVGKKVAIEIEGGTFGFGPPCRSCGQRKQGGHNRGKHFAEDCEKYNSAARLGWIVFRLTGEMITVENVKEIIGFVEWRTGAI